jgi:predicted RND superfamily exporter protein
MWYKISSIVIKNRLVFLLITLLISLFMGWQCRKLEISYDYVQIVPEDDPEYVYYRNFKKTFGEDGSIFALGMQDKSIYTLEKFSKLQKLCAEFKKIEGVKDVISLPTLKNLVKDTANKKFDQQIIFPEKIRDQKQLDSLLKEARNVKVYDKLLVNENTNALLVAISLEAKYLNSGSRAGVMEKILTLAKDFSEETNIELHYAGLPYIRSIMVKEMKSELITLLCLSVLVTSGILFLFFRSFSSVVFTFLVIVTTLICTGGTIVTLGYKVTILTGVLPALIIIISIPNCIYMYNKYHQEYKRHRNKIKAVSRIIEKIGFLTFMTNINTAVGFFVLYFTNIVTIKQFGLVAGILSVATFLITLIIIPTFLLFLPPPTAKQLKHLDLGFLRRVNQILETATLKHRPWIYAITGLLMVISVYGISKLKPVSYMVDDLPERSSIRTDLAFFEQHFNGVMPLEIVIDLGKKKAVLRLSNLQKLEKLETYLLDFNNISPPLSILNVVKGATQAFYGGEPEFYRLPTNNERSFILKYFGSKEQQNNLLRAFVDSTGRYVRFTCKVADVGTVKMNELVQQNVQKKADEIFSKEDGYEVKITGTTLLFLKGNAYLINDLSESLVYSFILISLMMAFIFTSPKMILISMIPNVIPMVMTAGIMGLFHIPLKPSTALIFGISFGISIDSTIHFLSKYKQEMVFCKGNVLAAVTRSMQEAGVSMIYTSVVLFCGFIIFVFSNFGGTVALGLLTSLTLFFAMFTNLTILPALLLTFSKGDHKVPMQFPEKKNKKKLDESEPIVEAE